MIIFLCMICPYIFQALSTPYMKSGDNMQGQQVRYILTFI